MAGRNHSEETRLRISKSMTGKKKTETSKQRLSQFNKENGVIPPKKKAKCKTEEIKTDSKAYSKRCKCIETGIVYNSIRDAERLNKCKHIGDVIRQSGRVKTAGGYHWGYA